MRRMTLPHVLLGLLALLATVAWADVVILRNKVLEGEILSEDEDWITLKSDGEEQRLHRRYVQELVRGVDREEYLRGLWEELEAEDVKGRIGLGKLAARNQEKELAREIYEEVLELDPTNGFAGRSLHYVKDEDGRWIPPEDRERPTTQPSQTAEATGPGAVFTITETINGEPWEQYLLGHPNPEYSDKGAVGRNLAFVLLGKEHGWRVTPAEEAGNSSRAFEVTVTATATEGETTTWMNQKSQVFYFGKVTVKVVRVKDGVTVLQLEGEAKRGDHDESYAAYSSMVTAALALVRDKKIKELPLWSDPAGAPAMAKPIKVEHESMKHRTR